MSAKTELYEKVTARIVEAMEAGVATGDNWTAPWHTDGVSFVPQNAVTHKPYRGVNVITLWSEQQLRGYVSAEWATYKQWKSVGAQVREHEHGSKVLLWKPTKRKVTNDNGDEERVNSLYATSYTVFNAAQVDGYETVTVERDPFEVVDEAKRFFDALGADVRHGGNRAYYSPGADRIQLPVPEDFKDNVAYYATSAHEHTHWTSHESRCDRKLGDRFGDKQYAAEELIAELGAAFVCSILGLENEPRADHAEYVANWISLLKEDSSAIVTAASAAQRAVDWMVEHATVADELQVAV